MILSNLDKTFIHFARNEASRSLNKGRKCGCIIRPLFADDFGSLVGGTNNFPQGVARMAERVDLPACYQFTEHAERAAVYQAAHLGIKLAGSTVYLTWYPCADCARALVAVGVVRLVAVEPDWSEEQYGFHAARAIMAGNVRVDFYKPEDVPYVTE